LPKILPVLIVAPAVPTRAWISSQIRSSDQSPGSVAGSVWKYGRCTFGDLVEISANPRSEWA
jgi:hypothetical protein